MLFSDARRHKVVASSSAATIGRVSQLVVDPVTRSVVALQLKKTEGGDVLRWGDLTAFGADAVTVTDAGKIGDGDETVRALTGKDHRVLGKRVLTSEGDDIGKVADVDFDTATGALTAILVDSGNDVAADRLLGVGSYAVVVRDAP
jgi:sporulation protein YlmC with PRC-barrel domain